MVLWKEAWQGLAESCAKESCVPPNVLSPDESSTDLSTQGRVGERNFEGRWKAYDVSAVPIDEEDPLTGQPRESPPFAHSQQSQCEASRRLTMDTVFSLGEGREGKLPDL